MTGEPYYSTYYPQIHVRLTFSFPPTSVHLSTHFARNTPKDLNYRAPTINITNNKTTVEGNGMCLCDTPIDQLRAFWEFEIEDMGTTSLVKNEGDEEEGETGSSASSSSFALGVVRRANLKPNTKAGQIFLTRNIGKDARSKGMQSSEFGVDFHKGDVLGVALDMNYKRLTFYMNGESLNVEITLEPRFCAPFPAVYVKGSRLTANWSGPFSCFPNELEMRDYDGIVAARSIL